MSKNPKAKRKPQSKSGSAGGMLVGLFIGLMLGAVVAVLGAWYFTQNAPFKGADAQVDRSAGPAPGSEPVALPGRPGGKPLEKPQFDFYKILPEGNSAGLPAPPAELPPAAPAAAERLFLQAGAFEDPSEADNVKARLALMGVEASVARAEVPGRGAVHRVRIGPFDSEARLDQVRRETADAGIPTVPVKAQ